MPYTIQIGPPVRTPKNVFQFELKFDHGDADSQSLEVIETDTGEGVCYFYDVLAWIKSESPSKHDNNLGAHSYFPRDGEDGPDRVFRVRTDPRFIQCFFEEGENQDKMKEIAKKGSLEDLDDDEDFFYHSDNCLWPWDQEVSEYVPDRPATLESVECFWYDEKGVKYEVSVTAIDQ